MGLRRCVYLVRLLSPPGILYWILVSTIQGHSRSVTSHKVKSDLVKSYKEQNFFCQEVRTSSQSRCTYMETRNLKLKTVQSGKGIVKSS